MSAQQNLDFMAGRMRAQRAHEHPRCWGISSDSLALYGIEQGQRPLVPGHPNPGSNGGAFHGDECGTGWPSDPSDLLACELTYRRAPTDVQERMLPVLLEFRAWVLDGINRYGVKLDRGYRGRVIAKGERVPTEWGDCLDPSESGESE